MCEQVFNAIATSFTDDAQSQATQIRVNCYRESKQQDAWWWNSLFRFTQLYVISVRASTTSDVAIAPKT